MASYLQSTIPYDVFDLPVPLSICFPLDGKYQQRTQQGSSMKHITYLLVLTTLTMAAHVSLGQDFSGIQSAQERWNGSTLSRSKQTVRQVLADKKFLILSAGVYAGTAFDIHSTVDIKRWYNFSDPPTKLSAHFSDRDPLARPFVDLPTSAYYATGLTLATGINWLAWKMRHSSRFRREWWLPQLLPAVNLYCGIQNTRQYNYDINTWKRNNHHP